MGATGGILGLRKSGQFSVRTHVRKMRQNLRENRGMSGDLNFVLSRSPQQRRHEKGGEMLRIGTRLVPNHKIPKGLNLNACCKLLILLVSRGGI